MLRRVIALVLPFLLFLAQDSNVEAARCPPGASGKPIACDGDTEAACPPLCCWDPTADEHKCLLYPTGKAINRLSAAVQKNRRNLQTPEKTGLEDKAKIIVQKFEPNETLSSEENIKSTKRHLGIGSPFGALPGGAGILSLIAGDLFPKCPVDIKICYRTACGGPNAAYLQNNPTACLSDPTCCYDYDLAVYRRILGPRFMGDAPTCYVGATSRQWVYLASLIKPWNPWLGPFLLDKFDSFLDTSFINFGGKLACSIKDSVISQRTACPGGVTDKKSCNLKDCCWNKKKKTCTKASQFILNALGSKQVYPSVYTNDPRETQCPNTLFDFGPKAYKRMPCSVGKQPDEIFDILFNWCPSSECCLNYYALDNDKLTQLQLFSQLGSGGGGGGGFNFAAAAALGGGSLDLGTLALLGGNGGAGLGLGAGFGPGSAGSLGGGLGNLNINTLLLTGALSGKNDLEKIFCPYYFFEISSSLPSLNADGCCEIPPCFYKKKLVGGGIGPIYPPTDYPTLPPTPPVHYGQYGSWLQCVGGPCGGYGSRTRKCYVNGRESPGSCSGPDQERCQMPGCVGERAQWTDWSASSCSRTCGPGTARYTRSCMYYGRPVNPAQCGGGPTTDTRSCNLGICPIQYRWGDEMRVIGTCERTCTGRQMAEQTCFSATGQQVDKSYCPGSPNNEYKPCEPAPCSGHGSGGYSGTPDRLCKTQGTNPQYQVCQSVSECPPVTAANYYWTDWSDYGSCTWKGQSCVSESTRTCYEQQGNQYVKVEPQFQCGSASDRSRTRQCNFNECSFQG